MYNYEKETYFRAVSVIRKEFLSSDVSIQFCLEPSLKDGRNQPSVIRPDAEIVLFPGLSAFRSLCFLTGLISVFEYNDYQISLILDQILNQARIHQYQGQWGIYKDLIEYFKIDKVDNFEHINGDLTVFSIPEFYEWILTHYSEDDLFGNIVKQAIQLLKKIKIRKPRSVVTSTTKVRYPQRHRGYRDKGSNADFKDGFKKNESFARKRANLSYYQESEPKYSSLSQICRCEYTPPKKKNFWQRRVRKAHY